MESSKSIFSKLKPQQIDELFPKLERMRSVKSPDKIDLIVGMYRTDEGKPHFFNTTRKVERELF